MDRKWGRGSLAAALLVGVGLQGVAAPAAELAVRVDEVPPAGLPLELSGELAAALNRDPSNAATPPPFSVRGPHQPCRSQTVVEADGRSRLYWLPAGPGRYAVNAPTARDTSAGAGPDEAPIAREEADAIQINTGAFTARHQANRAGGFPSAITVAGAPVPLPIEYADRLYRPDVGEFSLVHNPKPAIRLVANGPLLAIVEVSTGYYQLQAGQPRPAAARPQARYRFTYYRHSPLVQVQVAVSQSAAFAWKELHVLELRAPAGKAGPENASRPNRWAGGEPAVDGAITHAGGTHLFSRWAALYSDNGVVAILNPRAAGDGSQPTRVHDGAGLLYVMGPWVEFAGPRLDFVRYLYLGPGGPPPPLAELAGQLDRMQPPRVLFPELEAQARARRQLLQAGAGPGRILQLWQINQALADLHALRNVAGARQLLAQAPSVPAASQPGPQPAAEIPAGPERTVLVTDQLVLARDGRGRLTSLYQPATDVEWLAQPCAMFRCVVRNPAGEEAQLTAHEADRVTTEFKAGAWHLRYRGQVFGATTAAVELTLRPEGASVFWSAAATLEGGTATCWRLDFPVLDGLGRAGADPADAVIVPDGWGRRLPRPEAAHYQARYPGGSATMQCVGYARSNATLGVIARDGRCFAKDLVARGSAAAPTLALELRHYPEDMGSAHACQWPYEVETVALAGDWFALAQHYRAWATRQSWCDGGRNRRRPDTPEWFRKLVWWHHDGTRDGARLLDTLAHLRQAVPFPLAFHWYNWHAIPFDNFYPDYFPANAYVPEVRAQLRAQSIPVMPYINGHLWDPQAESYRTEKAVRWAMKKFDGSIYTEHYNRHDHATACPFTAAWRDKMVQVTDRLFREFGVDAVYLDQIGAVSALLCYDAAHGHPRGGGDYYAAGYQDLLQAVRANARRINPAAALTTEDTAEPYLRYLDGTLMCNRAFPDSIAFFPAVYHEHIAQFGLYIHEPEIQAGVTYRSKEAMLFQFGAQLGWNGTSWSEAPAHREKFRWLALLAAYRQLGLDWLAYGAMLAPPPVALRDGTPLPRIAETWLQFRQGIPTEQPAVTASAWRTADGRVAIFVVNVADQPLPVTISLPAEAAGRSISEWKPSGQVEPAAPARGGQLLLDLAPQSVRMLVVR